MKNPEQIIIRSRQYGKLLEQLRKEMDALGYRILAPDQLDPYTIERAAEMVISNALKWDDAEDIAAAIRALKGEG